MSSGSRAIVASCLLLALTIALRASGQDQAPGLKSQDPVAHATGDYSGSQACARCHDVEHAQWTSSLHVKMTKPLAEATVVGDFRDGTKFADHDRSYTFGTKDGRPYVSVSFGGRAPETFSVDYTLGAKRFQGYLATLSAGRIYVLPVFWHIASRRWVDWKEITPIPDGAHDIRQIWNANCFNCHGTNIVQGCDVAEKRYNSTWTDILKIFSVKSAEPRRRFRGW